jgi:hypothetical protein
MHLAGASSRKPEVMGWRVAVSIVAFFGSIIAAILCLFFYAESFNVYQSIAVVVVIFLSSITVMGATWGMKQGSCWTESKH